MPLLDEASIRITEAARELGRYAETLGLDSARQAAVEKRLAAAEELARKHRVPLGELPQRRATLRSGARQRSKPPNRTSPPCAAQQAEALPTYRELATQLSSDARHRGRAPSARKSPRACRRWA